MNRISDTTLTSLLDLKKHLVHLKDGKICWKMYDLEIPASGMFNSLSDKNKNRILYYGVSVMDNALRSYRIEKIAEILDMQTYYDTSTKENACIVFVKSFKDNYPPACIFRDYITVTSFRDILNTYSLDSLEINENQALVYYLQYASFLLCNFEWNDGVTDFFCPSLSKLPNMDTMDKILDYLFFTAKLPEPTINYLSNGEARVMRG